MQLIIIVILPLKRYWWLAIEFIECSDKVEEVVEEVEIAAEMVEKVAITIEKVSAEVADKLPDNSKLKEAALVVQHISSVSATDAQLAEDFIHKVCAFNFKKSLLHKSFFFHSFE